MSHMRPINILVLATCFLLAGCGTRKVSGPDWLPGEWEGHYAEQKGMYSGQENVIQLNLKPDGSFAAVFMERYMGIDTAAGFEGQWDVEGGDSEGSILVLTGRIKRWLKGRAGDPVEQPQFEKSELVWRGRVVEKTREVRAEDWDFPPNGAVAIKINPLLRVKKMK